MSAYVFGEGEYTPSGGDLFALLRSKITRASGSSMAEGASMAAAGLLHYVSLGTGLFDGSIARAAAEYLIRFGSGSQVCASFPRNVEAVESRPAALSAADQTRELLAALALNKSQLADIMRVSRPTVYEWLDENEPASANQERLTSILRILSRSGVSSSSPLNTKLVRYPLPGETVSLLDLLGAEFIDEHASDALLRKARELTQEMKSRRVEREQRLRSLGFDDASSDQRRQRLDRNLALTRRPGS